MNSKSDCSSTCDPGEVVRDWFDWTPYIILAAVALGTVCATLIRRQIVQRRKKKMMQSGLNWPSSAFLPSSSAQNVDNTSTTTREIASLDGITVSSAASGRTHSLSSTSSANTLSEPAEAKPPLQKAVFSGTADCNSSILKHDFLKQATGSNN